MRRDRPAELLEASGHLDAEAVQHGEVELLAAVRRVSGSSAPLGRSRRGHLVDRAVEVAIACSQSQMSRPR